MNKDESRKRRNDKKTSNRNNKRLEDYLFLSFRIASKFNASILSFEERQQAALLGILRGLETYEEGRSSELHWLYSKGVYAVEDAIRREARSLRNTQHVEPDSLATIQHSGQTPLNKLITREEQEITETRITIILKELKRLEPRIRYIVRKIALEGEKQQTVAERMGISQSWCSRLYNAGLDKLRENVLTQDRKKKKPPFAEGLPENQPKTIKGTTFRY